MPEARLTLEGREEISRRLVAEESFREIAWGLERPASTISREVDGNGGRPLEIGSVQRSTRRGNSSQRVGRKRVTEISPRPRGSEPSGR